MCNRDRGTPQGTGARRLASAVGLALVASWAWPDAAQAAARQVVSTPQVADAGDGHGTRQGTHHGPPTTEDQRERVSRLMKALHAAAEEARRANARLANDATLDTVRAGSLVLLVEPEHEALAQGAAESAWMVLDSLYGSAATRLELSPLVLRSSPTTERTGDTIDVAVMLTVGEPGRRLVALNARMLRQRLVSNGASSMRSAMGPSLEAWLGTYGSLALGRGIYERAYEALVTSPSRVARGCLLGEIADCREALVLARTDDPIGRWYDAPRRRELVQARRWPLRTPSPASYDACIAGDDAACTVVLRRLAPGDVPTPLPVAARQALVHTAVELGGRDAFARLLQPSDAPLDARLGAAAGVPPDSLLVAWRSRVMAAKPRHGGFPGSTGPMALVWTAFFGFLATRSSRWR